MSTKTVKALHIAYSVLLSLLLVGTGIALIVTCVQIYQSGDRPFSRESVAEAFSHIAVLVYLCLAFVLGDILRRIVCPQEKTKLRAQIDPVTQRKRLGARVDLARCPDTLAVQVQKQRRIRLLFNIIGAVLLVLSVTAALIYLLNPAHSQALDTRAEIRKSALVVFFSLALPFLFSVVTLFVNRFSTQKEIALLKEALTAIKPNSVLHVENADQTGTNAHSQTTRRRIVVALLLLAALALITAGIANGGADDVVQKAIKICTECIGLG